MVSIISKLHDSSEHNSSNDRSRWCHRDGRDIVRVPLRSYSASLKQPSLLFKRFFQSTRARVLDLDSVLSNAQSWWKKSVNTLSRMGLIYGARYSNSFFNRSDNKCCKFVNIEWRIYKIFWTYFVFFYKTIVIIFLKRRHEFWSWICRIIFTIFPAKR